MTSSTLTVIPMRNTAPMGGGMKKQKSPQNMLLVPLPLLVCFWLMVICLRSRSSCSSCAFLSVRRLHFRHTSAPFGTVDLHQSQWVRLCSSTSCCCFSAVAFILSFCCFLPPLFNPSFHPFCFTPCDEPTNIARHCFYNFLPLAVVYHKGVQKNIL